MVDPLLPPRAGLDDPTRIDFEGRCVERAQLGRHAVDLRERAVEILEIGHHHVVPQIAGLEVAHEVLIDDGKLA